MAPGCGSHPEVTRESGVLGKTWLSDGPDWSGGGRSFLMGETEPSGVAVTFSPLPTLIDSPPAAGATEALPFEVTTDVAFCGSTPICVWDAESTTTCVPGVRTVDVSSTVATSIGPDCTWTEFSFFVVRSEEHTSELQSH